MEISGKTFLVTGGGSGLGAATAERLISDGANVVVADVNSAAGEAVASALGGNAAFVHTDVALTDSVQGAIQVAHDVFGTLDGAINCAGIGTGELVVPRDSVHSLESFTRVLNVNLIGTFNVIRLVAQSIAGAHATDGTERGIIVNTASVAAFDGQIGQAAYSASKGGVVAMTLPIARELGRHGIRVLTIAPGLFDTPLLRTLPDDARRALEQQVPFPPRLGKPSEYAALVSHIVENTMLNGEVIRLDGAIRMAAR